MNNNYQTARRLMVKSCLIILMALPVLLLLRPLGTGTAKDKIQKDQPNRPEVSNETARGQSDGLESLS
jgi:hypothetical protein